MIDNGNGNRVTTLFLARTTGCHPGRLRSLFKESFGVSIREYQTRRQVLHAARALASGLKVDAVARMSGFRSRKNFYAAFRRIAGTTPRHVREWAASDLESLERRLMDYSD
jgi:methylphosphotriester-DNA--protein-cysteine methyltransferase